MVATVIFILAVLHTFFSPKLLHWSHAVEERHRAALKLKPGAAVRDGDRRPDDVSFPAQTLHFLGEVEVIFGIWASYLLRPSCLSRAWLPRFTTLTTK